MGRIAATIEVPVVLVRDVSFHDVLSQVRWLLHTQLKQTGVCLAPFPYGNELILTGPDTIDGLGSRTHS